MALSGQFIPAKYCQGHWLFHDSTGQGSDTLASFAPGGGK